MSEMREPIESGVPDHVQYLHPLMKKNYGNWKYHDRPRPGVLHHVSHNGDQIWTVRAGTQRQMDVYTIRTLCDIADQFADGHVRFTVLPFFLLASASLIGAAMFPTDIRMGDVPLTFSQISTNGLIHTVSIASFILLCPFTIFLMVKAMIADPSWKDVARWTVAMSLVSMTLTGIWLVFYINRMYFDYRGIFQKGIALWTLLWMLLIALKTARGK